MSYIFAKDIGRLQEIEDFERQTRGNWQKQGIYLKKIGLIVAPEDYYDCYRHRHYFTWGEALRADGGTGMLYDRWRLPTIRDWKKIHRYFKPNSPEALQRMVDELHLDYTGYISDSDMIEYFQSPKNFQNNPQNIHLYGSEGYYWTRSIYGKLAGDFAKNYLIIKDFCGGADYDWRFKMFRIRCVKYI